MPLTTFDKLPDDARVWIFGAAAPVDDIDAAKLLAAVDTYLLQWKAHGHPLSAARDWRDERFLVIGVDQRTEGASGCSIDGLFRMLQELDQAVGSSMVGGGLVFFRGPGDLVCALARDDFEALARRGGADGATPVFDTTITTAGDYRTRFEIPAANGWHRALFPKTPAP